MLVILIPLAILGAVLAMGGSRAPAAHVSAIETLNAFLRQGQEPPIMVATLARDEALAIGDIALAASIAQTFLAPQNAPTAPSIVEPAPALLASPIPGIDADGWNALAHALARQAPTYDTGRRVGRYAASKSRLTEIGIDPQTILGSPNAQDSALCTDLADAHHHLSESGDLAKHLGRSVTIPDESNPHAVSLSGVLGVCSVAGIEGTIEWLENEGDRKKFPHTTSTFLQTNGIF